MKDAERTGLEGGGEGGKKWTGGYEGQPTPSARSFGADVSHRSGEPPRLAQSVMTFMSGQDSEPPGLWEWRDGRH